MNDKALILSTGLFSKLKEDKLNQLLSRVEEVTVRSNTVFIKEGERADACYIIKFGVCQIFTTTAEGKEVILARLENGNYFGEQALLTENPGKRNASIRAVSDLTLLKIDHATFTDILEFDQELKDRLQKIGHEQLLIKLQAQSAKFNIHEQIIGDINDYEHWKYETEDVILQEGAPSDGALFVVEGSVDIIAEDEEGNEQLISTVSAGNLIGELGVMTKNPRRASAIANGPVTIAFIPYEKFQKLHETNEDLKNMVDALKNSYQSKHRGRVIQYISEFMGMNAITTTFRLPDGRQIFTARVIGKSIQSIRHMDMAGTQTHVFDQGDKLTRELMVKNGLLLGVTAFGEWDNLSHLYRMVFDKEPISLGQITEFENTGDFTISNPPSVDNTGKEKDIVCECMWLTRGDIQHCLQRGAATYEEVSEMTGCGSVCASCTPNIQSMVASSGWKAVRIAKIKQLTPTTRSYTFVAIDNKPLPAFKPGQHILVQCEIDGNKIERAYSITSADNDTGRYEIMVKRENNGLFSNWIFSHDQEISVIKISTPAGKFIYDVFDKKPSVCFVNGIGVAPAISFARSLHNDHGQRMLAIHYSTDFGDDVVYDQELIALNNDENIEIHKHITKHQGPVSEDDVKKYIDRFPDATFYVCGPKEYENTIVSALVNFGVSEENIMIEQFSTDQIAA